MDANALLLQTLSFNTEWRLNPGKTEANLCKTGHFY
jgi:hypothetical protein